MPPRRRCLRRRAPPGAAAAACALAVLGCAAEEAADTAARAARAAPAAAGAPAAPHTVRLSDERLVTRYANAVVTAAVRTRPSAGAGRVARLRLQTEDGPLETYLALSRRADADGRTWVRVRLPGRPNGRTGWVRREHLGPLVTVRTMLRIDRAALRATLYARGRRIWTAAIGIGARATPTPAGRFWIRTRLRPDDPHTAYGPWAFGTSAYSSLSDWPGGGVVGIHGTNRPRLIPGTPSKGCVRVSNAKIRDLARLMPVGTPVRIT